METGVKVLIVGGVINIAVSFILGAALGRRRSAAPIEAHRFLLVAHEGALLQGVLLLSLTLALGLSDLSSGWETAAAWLLVVGSAFMVAGALTNWRKGIKDQFAERSLGMKLNAIFSTLAMIAVGIITVGVVTSL